MSLLDILMQSPMPAVYMAVPFFVIEIPLIMSKDWPLYAPELFRDEGCDEDRERQGWEHQRLQMLVYSTVLYLAFVLVLIFRD